MLSWCRKKLNPKMPACRTVGTEAQQRTDEGGCKDDKRRFSSADKRAACQQGPEAGREPTADDGGHPDAEADAHQAKRVGVLAALSKDGRSDHETQHEGCWEESVLEVGHHKVPLHRISCNQCLRFQACTCPTPPPNVPVEREVWEAVPMKKYAHLNSMSWPVCCCWNPIHASARNKTCSTSHQVGLQDAAGGQFELIKYTR